MVAEAQAKVIAAQDSLEKARQELLAAEQLKVETNNALTQAEQTLRDKGATANEKASAMALAKAAVDQAQANYDNNLIKQIIPGTTEPITVPGLRADIYNFNPNNAYPNRSTSEHAFCKTIMVDNIDMDWGGGDIEGCGGDFVIIHYTGFITVPKTDTYEFLAQVDDGWYMTIGNTVVNDNWVLKGCGGWWSQGIQLEAGVSYPIDAWMYEYGGGACNQLIYMNSETWDIAPADWFTQTEQQPFIMVKDPSLLIVLEDVTRLYDSAVSDYEAAQKDLSDATSNLRVLQDKQAQNVVTIDTAQQNVTTTEQAVINAQQELEAIPPFKEPTPTPEKTTEPTQEPTKPITPEIPEPVTPTPTELPVNIKTVNPQELSAEQVTELISVANEILNNSEQGSPEYEQALEALFVAAQADDIVIDPSLAAIPGISAAVDAINFIGNVGADMSPKVRKESQKIVVSAVVAVGAAVNAATGAALTAAAPSAGGASNNIRRKQ